MGNPIDETGNQYGFLTVIKRHGLDKQGQYTFECRCICGNTTIVTGSNLRSGNSRSCGCQGIGVEHHKESKTKLYRIWAGIIARTEIHSATGYEIYGGRGIRVCNEWRSSFVAFRDWAYSNGYEDGLTIERMNNDGPYSPDNCRWATIKEQANNKRNTVWITSNGETRNVQEWAKILDVRPGTIRERIIRGWSEDDAINRPFRKSPKRKVSDL